MERKTLKTSGLFGIALGLVLLAGIYLPGLTIAQEAQPSGQGLEISPPLIELSADPGETVVTEISVRNITGVDVVARGEVNDFVARDETGQPRILLDEDEESPYPLAAYVQHVPDLVIAPTEQETVEIVINVPENASPGGHFGLVRFTATPADATGEGSEVTLSASIGTLVLLRVSGDIEEELSIEDLFVEQDGERSNLFQEGPFSFITRLQNTGNVHLQPSGKIEVTNLLGREVTSLDFNENDRNVLPESIRRFEHEFEDKSFWFGRYTLTADLQYGADGTILQSSTDFWVIPYKILGLILLLIVAVGFFGRRSLQAYKKNVIKKYQSAGGSSEAQNQPPTSA